MATDKAISAWVSTMLETDEARRSGKTQKGLARALGLDQSQGNRIVQGKRRFKAAEIPLIERYLGARLPQELEDSAPFENPPPAPEGFFSVPVYDVRAAAGFGAVAEDTLPIDHQLFREDFLRRIAQDLSQLFILQVSGDSNWPTLHNGDHALGDRGQTDPRHEGFYIIRIDDVLQVKRLSMHPVKKTLTIKSDNDAYPSYSDVAPDDLAIVGRVIWIGRQMV